MINKLLNGNFGQYRVLREVARGGVGVVYEAQTLKTREHVAVKVLHQDRFTLSDVILARFQTEVRKSQSLRNPNIVLGLDTGIVDGANFLVMEWMSGGTLLDKIRNKSYVTSDAIRWTCHILSGLTYLIDNSLIHRDIKSNNIMIDHNRVAKIADLGTIKDYSLLDGLTNTSDPIGSLVYISKHQRDNPVQATSADDFYSTCVVLYELATATRFHPNAMPIRFAATRLLPEELCHLVQMGIDQTWDWRELLSEMMSCIDRDSALISTSYKGSPLTLGRFVASEFKTIVEGAQSFSLTGTQENVITNSNSLSYSENINRTIVKYISEAIEDVANSGLMLFYHGHVSSPSGLNVFPYDLPPYVDSELVSHGVYFPDLESLSIKIKYDEDDDVLDVSWIYPDPDYYWKPPDFGTLTDDFSEKIHDHSVLNVLARQIVHSLVTLLCVHTKSLLKILDYKETVLWAHLLRASGYDENTAESKLSNYAKKFGVDSQVPRLELLETYTLDRETGGIRVDGADLHKR